MVFVIVSCVLGFLLIVAALVLLNYDNLLWSILVICIALLVLSIGFSTFSENGKRDWKKNCISHGHKVENNVCVSPGSTVYSVWK